jgi:hypothetical protein
LFYACNKTGTVVHCFTYETTDFTRVSSKDRGKKTMSSEFIWETFDSLWKTVNRQGRRVEELEARVIELESRLAERAAAEERRSAVQSAATAEFPVERAA